MKKMLFTLALGVLGVSNYASAASGSVQLGFIPDSELEVDSDYGYGELEGDGVSLKASFKPNDSGLLIFGGLVSREFEDVFDIDQTRLGVGWSGAQDRLGYWVGFNYEKLEVDSSEASGVGLRGGLSFAFNEVLALYGEIGSYALSEDSTDITGSEFSIGFAFMATQSVSLFTDLRAQVLEVEDDYYSGEDEFTVTDFRIGVGFFF